MSLYEGSFNTHDICVFKEEYQDDKIILGLKARNEAIYDLRYQYTIMVKKLKRAILQVQEDGLELPMVFMLEEMVEVL